MHSAKSFRIIYIGLLAMPLLGLAGCKGGGTAPKIPVISDKGEAVMIEEESIFLKEAPEGTRGTRPIK